MQRRNFLASALAAGLARGASGKRPPNILYIMADDHAAHAISAYGSRIDRTPNIDRIGAAGVPCRRVNKVKEGRPHIVDMLKNGEVSLIVNTTEGEQAIADSYAIRRTALKNKVAYTTTLAGARAVVMALRGPGTGEVHRLQDLHRGLFS